MDAANIFDLLISLCGLYLIYAAVVMKKDGRIVNGIVSKENIADGMRNKEGFIKYMFGKIMLLGITATLAGIIGIVNTKLEGPAYISLIGTIVFFAALVLFTVASGKAKKKYIEGRED